MSGVSASAPAAALPFRVRISYGFGSLFTSIYGTLPQVVLLYFMTSQLGIAPALAGVVIFTPKLLEVFFDPALGLWSDGLRTRWGRRRPLMLCGIVGFALCFPWLLNPPLLATPGAYAVYTLLVFAACTASYSLFFVPYLAMPAEMGISSHEQTRLMAMRISFLSLGVMVAGAGAPWLVNQFGGGLRGYAWMGGCFTILCVTAMLVAVFGTLGAPQAQAGAHSLTLREQLRLARANRPFVMLASAYGLQACALGAFAAALPYFVQHVLRAPPQVGGLAFLTVTLTALLTIFGWVALGKRVGKRRAYGLATLIYALAALLMWLPGADTTRSTLIAAFVILGLGFGGMQLFSHAMLPEATQNDARRTGMNREALFSGLWIAVEKAGFATGAMVVGGLLQWGGLQATQTTSGLALQPESVVLAIRVAIALVPGVLFFASLFFIRRYALEEASGKLAS